MVCLQLDALYGAMPFVSAKMKEKTFKCKIFLITKLRTYSVGDVRALKNISEVRLLKVVVDRPHNNLNVALLKEVNHFSTTLTRRKRCQPPATRTLQ